MKKRMGIVAAVATAMLCSSFAFAAPIKIGLMAPITRGLRQRRAGHAENLRTHDGRAEQGRRHQREQGTACHRGRRLHAALRRNRRQQAGRRRRVCRHRDVRLGRDRGLAGHLRRSGDRADRYRLHIHPAHRQGNEALLPHLPARRRAGPRGPEHAGEVRLQKGRHPARQFRLRQGARGRGQAAHLGQEECGHRLF